MPVPSPQPAIAIDVVHFSVERDGWAVILAARAASGANMTLRVRKGGAAALAASLRSAAEADDDCDFELSLRAELSLPPERHP